MRTLIALFERISSLRSTSAAPCTFPGCTGRFDPKKVDRSFTGWTFSIHEADDVPAHDCTVKAQPKAVTK